MPACPHCNFDIDSRHLVDHVSLENGKSCPLCQGAFTVDAATRKRQFLSIFIACLSAAFTLSLFFLGSAWLIPATISYLVLGVFIYWGNRHVKFIPFQESSGSATDPDI